MQPHDALCIAIPSCWTFFSTLLISLFLFFFLSYLLFTEPFIYFRQPLFALYSGDRRTEIIICFESFIREILIRHHVNLSPWARNKRIRVKGSKVATISGNKARDLPDLHGAFRKVLLALDFASICVVRESHKSFDGCFSFLPTPTSQWTTSIPER